MSKNLQALQKLIATLDEKMSSSDLALALGSAILLISKELKETKEDTSKLDELRKELEEAITKIELQKGDKGDDGKNGEDGEKGERGEQGISGKDGKDGKDGKSGIDGIDGRSGIDGINGRDGIDGKDGRDGTEIEPEQIRNKLELLQGNERLSIKAIKEWEDLLKEIESKIASIPRGGGVSAMGVRQAFKYIFHTEKPVGAIDGANLTYTVSNDIWAIMGFTLNGENIAELPNFTFANKTITFTTALPVDYATRDWEIKYIG